MSSNRPYEAAGTTDMSIDPEELDLLVDGELPEDQRKRLLLSLEQVSGGWRACALAFLEAQCWRRECRSLAEAAREARAAAPGETVRSAATPPSRQSAPWRHGPTMLAMAASFLITMVTVGIVRMQWQSGGVPGPNRIARNEPAAEEGLSAPSPDALADSGKPSGERSGKTTAPADDRWLGTPVRMMTVSMPGDDPQSDRELVLPAIEASHFNDGVISAAAPAGIDPQLEALLRQNGLEIRSHRQLVPVRTDEGRDVVFPVNRYEIRSRDGSDIQ
jgi:hypothetical protein